MKPTGRAALRLGVLGAGLATLAFAILAAWRGVDEARAHLSRLDPLWFGAAVLAWTLSLWPQGQRWRCFLPGTARPGGPVMGGILWGTNVLHLLFPGPVSEAMAAWIVDRRWRSGLVEALGAAVLARLWALVLLGVLGVLGLLLGAPSGGTSARALAASLALGGLLAGLLGLVPGRLVGPLSRLHGGVGQRVAGWARSLAAVGAVPRGRWAEAAAWSLVNVGCLSVATWCGLRAAGLPVGFWPSAWAYVLVALATVAMIVSPGGLGPLDVFCVLAYPLVLGVTPSEALVGNVVLRLVQVVHMALGVPVLGWWIAREGSPEAAREAVAGALRPMTGTPGKGQEPGGDTRSGA